MHDDLPKIDFNSSSLIKAEEGMNEIILYQPDSTLSLDVKVKNETVWLSQAQMAELFQKDRTVIGRHINNIFKEGELERDITCANFAHMGTEGDQKYVTTFYSLDVIISVGYRVKSKRGTQFRIWANQIIKDYLLRGYSVNHRLLYLEDRIDRKFLEYDKRLGFLTDKVDFFVRTSLPPKEGVFFNGQIFDAHQFINNLIRSAKKRVILIDNFVDDTVLTQLDNRLPGVTAIIYTRHIDRKFALDLERHNDQYAPIDVRTVSGIHDRFLIIDDTLFHIGASMKDLGCKLFAFSKMETPPSLILDNI